MKIDIEDFYEYLSSQVNDNKISALMREHICLYVCRKTLNEIKKTTRHEARITHDNVKYIRSLIEEAEDFI